MSSATLHPLAEERLEAAADWLVRLRERPADAALITAWLQWCQEHPDNPRAFDSIQEIWTLSGDATLPAAHAAPGMAAESLATPAPVRKKNRWVYIAGMAAALLLAVGLWRAERAGFDFPEFVRRDGGSSTATEYTTAQAVDREVHLADGSILRLGGASTVRVTYSTAQRNVELRRGEAYFEVQHDAARPFVVRAGAVTVTAVGTAFNVRTDGGRIVVAVSEGVVEVVPRPAHAGGGLSSVRASSGQQVTLDHVSTHAADPTLAVQLSDAPPSDDWREGMLVFVDEPLRRVVARVNRYSRHDIVLADDAAGELRFTGTVLRDSIEDWVKGLEGAFAVHAQTRPDGSIALRSSAGTRETGRK